MSISARRNAIELARSHRASGVRAHVEDEAFRYLLRAVDIYCYVARGNWPSCGNPTNMKL